MRFRLTTIAYVFALLATGMAAFGGWGILVAAGVGLFWLWIYSGAPGRPTVSWLVWLVVIIALMFLLLPAVQSAREASRWNGCRSNLKQIGLALTLVEKSRGSLPAAYAQDAAGRRLHIWRTAMLPTLEMQTLHERIRHDEPWNSPANARLLSTATIEIFQCPAHAGVGAETHYFAVVDERTAWPPTGGRRSDELRDPRSATILVLEGPKRAIWSEPVDLTYDEAVEYLTHVPSSRSGMHEVQHGYFYKRSWAVNALFADGQVRALHLPLRREIAEALLTTDGGEPIDQRTLQREIAPRLDRAKCYAHAVFALLALWPGGRLAWGRRFAAAPAAR